MAQFAMSQILSADAVGLTGSMGQFPKSAVPASQPSAADVDLFRQVVGAPQPASQVPPSGFMSQAIGEGIKQAAETYRARFESLRIGLQNAEKTRSLGDLMRWQLESSRVGVEMEFTGKMASKITQDIEQLTKQQG